MKKLLVLFLCLGFGSCATAQVFSQEDDKYTANFKYTLPVPEAPSSHEVIFTVANTNYEPAGGLAWFAFPQFANLPGALRHDLTEVLIAKGFSVRGPYDSYDLIPFQDKKAIDLLLIPTVALTVSIKDQKEDIEIFGPGNLLGFKPETLRSPER